MAEVQDATLDRAGLTAGFRAALSWGMTNSRSSRHNGLCGNRLPSVDWWCRHRCSLPSPAPRGITPRPAPPWSAIAAMAAYYVFATEAFHACTGGRSHPIGGIFAFDHGVLRTNHGTARIPVRLFGVLIATSGAGRLRDTR